MRLKYMNFPSFVRFFEYSSLLEALQNKKGTLLDIGCSDTNLTEYLKELGFNAIGIDIVPDREGTICEIKKMDARRMDFKVETFDIVVSISTIEHIGFNGDAHHAVLEDQDGDLRTMKEIKRILKDDGIVIVSFPYLCKSHQANERNYTPERVEKLIEDYDVIRKRIFSGPSTHAFRESNKANPQEINVLFLVLSKKEY